jgi:hypothetical protein
VCAVCRRAGSDDDASMVSFVWITELIGSLIVSLRRRCVAVTVVGSSCTLHVTAYHAAQMGVGIAICAPYTRLREAALLTLQLKLQSERLLNACSACRLLPVASLRLRLKLSKPRVVAVGCIVYAW